VPERSVKKRLDDFRSLGLTAQTYPDEQSWLALLEDTSPAERALVCGSSRRFFQTMAESLAAEKYLAAEQRARDLAEAASAPIVSVIMPVVGEFDLADRAIRSVLLQSYLNLEVIVIVDKDAADIKQLTDIVRADSRVRVLRDDGNGSGAARNLGVDLAHGEYIAFLDHDDWFMPTKIAKQSAAMIEHGFLFSHTSYLVVYPSRNLGPAVMHSGRKTGTLFPEIMSNCPIATPTVMIHRAIAAGGFRFPTEYHLGADSVLWTEIASTYPVLGIDVPLSVVEWSDESAAINLMKQSRALKTIHDAFAGHPIFGSFGRKLEELRGAMQSLNSQRSGNDIADRNMICSNVVAELFQQFDLQ
jgi:hypothetical protein